MHNTFPEIIAMCQETARLYDRIAADRHALRQPRTDAEFHAARIARVESLVAQLRADLEEVPVPDYAPARTCPEAHLSIIRALCARHPDGSYYVWRAVMEALADGTDLFPILHLLPRDVLVRLAYIHTR